MKSGPTTWMTTVHHTNNTPGYKLRPIVLASPPSKKPSSTSTNSLKMKSRKRSSPKDTPLPSISTLFEPCSSLSSSSNSSYGSYCQFSPEGTYTMYQTTQPNYNYNTYPQSPMMSTYYDTTTMQYYPAPPTTALVDPNEHKPVNQPLFIQTSDFGYGNEPSQYPTTSTISTSQLLLRPVPNTSSS